MKSCYAAGFAIGMSLVIAGCSGTPPPAPDTRADDEKAIREGETAWNAEFRAKDLDKVVSHYANEATLMVPGEHLAKGKDAIRAVLAEAFKDKNFASSCITASMEVAKSGDIAYSQGSCATTMSDRKTGKLVNEKDNFVTVYKKPVGGSWMAVEDIVTAEETAAPAAPAKKVRAKSARRRR